MSDSYVMTVVKADDLENKTANGWEYVKDFIICDELFFLLQKSADDMVAILRKDIADKENDMAHMRGRILELESKERELEEAARKLDYILLSNSTVEEELLTIKKAIGEIELNKILGK